MLGGLAGVGAASAAPAEQARFSLRLKLRHICVRDLRALVYHRARLPHCGSFSA